MDTSSSLKDHATVEEVLQQWPETWTVFVSHNTHCVGCFMQRFCSLREVAEAYQLQLPDFLEELADWGFRPNSTHRSIK